MSSGDHKPDFFFMAACLAANKKQRWGLVAIYVGIPLCILLAFLWLFRPSVGATSKWEAAYSITGMEYTRIWTLKESEFVSLLNSKLSEYDVSPLTYLESYSESERQKMLTANGETWTVLFHICPEDAESDYIWSKYPEVKTWLTNLEDVELYFPASGDWNEKKPYVRSLISIFTPGAEDYVISKLSLSAKFRVTSSVIVDNVVYTRTNSSLLIEPDEDA